MSENFHYTPSKWLICGPTGSGKSTLYLATLKAWPSNWKFVFDPEREAATRLGIRVCETDAELGQAASRGGWIVYDPTSQFGERTEDGFRKFSQFAFMVSARLPAGPKLFATDEFDDHVSKVTSGPVARIFRLGRRRELDCLCVTHAPQAIPPQIRRQLTKIAAFRHGEPRDLDWLAAFGLPSKMVAGLPPFHFITRDNKGQIGAGKVPVAARV